MSKFIRGDKVTHVVHGHGVISDISPGGVYVTVRYDKKDAPGGFYIRTHSDRDVYPFGSTPVVSIDYIIQCNLAGDRWYNLGENSIGYGTTNSLSEAQNRVESMKATDTAYVEYRILVRESRVMWP